MVVRPHGGDARFLHRHGVGLLRRELHVPADRGPLALAQPSARRWSPRGSRTTSCDSAARRPRPLPPRMPDATGDSVSVRCCIAGGGPAGIMLGLLLARAGVSVLVLEKHADFLRDFRGDTIHPSTLDVMHELGLLDDVPARAVV